MTSTSTHEIERYTVSYFGGGKRSKRPYIYRAMITLHGSGGLIGTLFFHSVSDTLPESDQLADKEALGCHFLVDEMSRILDILRNEGPVFFHHYSHWPTMGVISTSQEPVGEGEIPQRVERVAVRT